MEAVFMDIFQLWQNICVEAGNLAAGIEQLPDYCESGDADQHLSGRCSHCGQHHLSAENAPQGLDCLEVISRLRADLAILNQDLSAAVPPLNIAAHETHQTEIRRGIFLAANDLQLINEAFERISESVVGFRRECTVSRMRAIKHYCLEFRNRCERVNAELNKKSSDVTREQKHNIEETLK